jgi:hydroxymethylpyrimidine/phosphomethylpyrimidine kinase
MQKALTIAGSDSGGGAGIQADLKTFTAFGVFGMSAVTALTAQNTLGVQGVHEIPPKFVAAQIESVAADLGADAVKTGMLGGAPVVEVVAACVRRLGLAKLVVDPVMVAKSGDRLLSPDAERAVLELLLPLAEVVTPNLAEAEALSGMQVKTVEEMKAAAARIHETGCRWVVVKGGHHVGREAIDVVYGGKDFTLLRAPWYEGGSVHGTGCTFSAAVAACLAQGLDPLAAVRRAKDFITSAIAGCLHVGQGHPAPDHFTGTSSDWA